MKTVVDVATLHMYLPAEDVDSEEEWEYWGPESRCIWKRSEGRLCWSNNNEQKWQEALEWKQREDEEH